MIRKRYVLLIVSCFVLLVWSLQSPASDQMPNESRLSAKELAVVAGDESPHTLEQKILAAVDDENIVVQSVDGKTVLMLEGEADDELTMSFSDVVGGVAAHVKLGKGGLGRRFTLVKPKGSDATPIYLDIKGPAVNGGYGVKITLRF